MKVLGLVGSSRKNGNTAYLVQQALDAIECKEIEKDLIFLGDHNIGGCVGCEGCKDTYKCVIMDDMQKIYPLILEADAIIMGSPTYFYNITANMKAFIDRCYCFQIFSEDDRSVWSSIGEVLGGKYAITIAICEQNDSKDMGYTSEAMSKPLEGLGYRVLENVKVLHLFEKGEAVQNQDAVDAARRAGRKLERTIILRKKTEAKLKF